MSPEASDVQANMDMVREYMEIAYTPGRASADAVAHLCAPDNRFLAPTTFPAVRTLEAYAADHGKLMEQVADLRLVEFDVLFGAEDRVCLRYSAEGSHCGQPHGEIQPTGRVARWTAACKLSEFIKEWNKLAMWEQLGWPVEECLSQH